MANKQDQKDAMNPAQLSEKLCLTEIKNHEWHIQVPHDPIIVNFVEL